MKRPSRATMVDAALLTVMTGVIFASVHPSLLLSTSLVTGGDTGAHVGAAAFLRQSGLSHLTPWYPGWFDGMPLYTYYFVLPDALAVLLSYVVPFTVAFKLVTLAGSLLMPTAAYLMGRLMKAPRPLPLALAAATLPFLFDASFTIDGGNLFSTMAGEYAFSLSLALSMIAVGLFARGVASGRGYWTAALVLAASLLSHALPFLFALGLIALIGCVEVGRRWRQSPRVDVARPTRFMVGSGLVTAGLVAWWLVPFVTLQSFTNSMGYVNDSVATFRAVATQLGWFNATGGAGGDRWVLVLAALGAVVAWATRENLGRFFSLWCVAAAGLYVGDPQSVIWNERLVPFWFLGTHLMAGWLVGYGAWRLHRSLKIAEVATSLGVGLLALVSVVPGQVPTWATSLGLATGGNQVSSWAAFNYAGYQGQKGWPEYHAVVTTMADVGRHYGCGQAMWEYASSENRFGTPEALMLLPYWTHNCIGSMEGLFFESSATTPYHFLDQAELSAAPSNPQVGLHYGGLDVAQGVRHLQLLGVRYYLAFSPTAVAQARRNPDLQLVATTSFYPAASARWYVFLIAHSSVVAPLTRTPRAVSPTTSRPDWLALNQSWWLSPTEWDRPYVAWRRPPAGLAPTVGSVEPAVEVRHVVVGTSTVSFDVSRVGVPVLVRVSYFPRWHASGAAGPYRASPNLMLVVPRNHHVVLTYGETPAQRAGGAITAGTLGVGGLVLLGAIRRRRATRR